MTTATETRETTPSHPFAAAIKGRDQTALVETLASDVVLHSAVTLETFKGRETVGKVYASVIDSFEQLEIVDEFSDGDAYVFFWRGRIEGRFVDGADRFRMDRSGRVREITVFARPLSGVSTFLTAIGGRFARGRRGPAVGTALTLTARPLPPLFSGLDPITRWLSKRGRR